MFVASVDTASLGQRAGLHPADYAYLRDLDRAGWAWEWLRRNPEFAALRAESGPSTTARRALFVGVDEVMERQLLRWGLHYG